jgi:hypothetical protein
MGDTFLMIHNCSVHALIVHFASIVLQLTCESKEKRGVNNKKA